MTYYDVMKNTLRHGRLPYDLVEHPNDIVENLTKSLDLLRRPLIFYDKGYRIFYEVGEYSYNVVGDLLRRPTTLEDAKTQ